MKAPAKSGCITFSASLAHYTRACRWRVQSVEQPRSLSKVVANKEYIQRLQMVIRQLHKCDAEHTGTEPVKEVFRGETVWEGDVEIFSVTGHPRAKRAYSWSVDKGTSRERFTAVLEIPPVKSALDAVKVAIVAAGKKREK